MYTLCISNIIYVYIDNVLSQRDLGEIITTKLCWTLHIDNLIAKASSRLGLLMRTCHFTTNKKQKGSFYLTLVRSIFEICSVVCSPQQASNVAKIDIIQKRAIKWIDGHPLESYTKDEFFNK